MLLRAVSPATFQQPCSPSLSLHARVFQSKAPAAPAAFPALKACQPGQGCRERNECIQGLFLLLPVLQPAKDGVWEVLWLCRDGVRCHPCVTLPSSPGLAHHSAPKGLAMVAGAGGLREGTEPMYRSPG